MTRIQKVRVEIVKKACFIAYLLMVNQCASDRTFWDYIIEDGTEKPMKERKEGTPAKVALSTGETIKVVYNDGTTSTEINIPVLYSGQQVLIEHDAKKISKSPAVNPLPPNNADKNIEQAYVKQGRTLNSKANSVSISKSHKKIRELVEQGDYATALEHVEQILERYPQHVKSLQAKGSILLQMGEKQAALDAYNKAQEIEEDPRVTKQIESIEKSIN